VDGVPIHAALDAGARGQVVEAFAWEDLTPAMADGWHGREQAAYRSSSPRAVAGGPHGHVYRSRRGAWLRQQGVHLAHGLSAHKARLLLMAVLGAGLQDRLAELVAQ